MELRTFLVKAKKATYASGASNEEKLPDGSRRFKFSEGCFLYIDKYYGSDPFSGQEVVWNNNKAIWSMNYYGRTLTPNAPKNVYDFLKEALRQVDETLPFRGPREFVKGKLKYALNVEGDLNKFKGQEKIYYQDQEVYNLSFCGGLISEN